MSTIFSSWIARYCSWILRSTLSAKEDSLAQSSERTVFFSSCCVIVLAPSEKLPDVMPTTPARRIPLRSMPLCS